MKSILVLALMFVSFFLNAQNNKDCKSVQVGVFKLISDKLPPYKVTRTKDHQLEEVKEHNYKAQFDIKWIDDCTYELSNKKLIEGDPRAAGKMGNILTVQIIEIKEKIILVRSSSNYSDLVTEIKMKIIE